jgi:hypothetical protein
MSDNNVFFRWVWRINAVLLLLIFLGAVVLEVWSFKLERQFTTSQSLGDWNAKHTKISFVLDPVEQQGLVSESRAQRLFTLSEKRTPEYNPTQAETIARNVLLVDEKTGTSTWLFDNNARTILDEAVFLNLPKAVGNEGGLPNLGYSGLAMVVAESDTNTDGHIDSNDRQSLYFYAAGSKLPVKILTADRIILEPVQFGETTLRVISQEKDKSFEIVYSIPDLKVLANVAISHLPNLAKPAKSLMKVGFITEPKNTDD